jgi:hypothetical protein
MLMACTTGRTANIAVKLQCPSSLNSEILVGVRERLTTPILASVSATNGKTPLTFTANEGSKAYEVVAGIDMNANHILDVSEVDMVFQKTPRTNPDGTSYSPHPGTTGDPTFQWIDRFIVVTENDYIDARNETEGYNGVILSATHPIAAELIGAFATGATTVSKSTSTDYSISITAGTFGLSHPVGAIWSATNQAATHRIVYDSTTELANLVVNSNGVRSMFGRILFNNKAALIAASSPAWGVVTISYTDNNIDFASSDKARQVHAIFGKCESVGGMQVSCRLTPTGAVEIGALNCYGSITDLYDFAYSASPIANIEPKKAARTQAGFATLTSATWPNAGRFFFTKVEFGTGWINYTATYTP